MILHALRSRFRAGQRDSGEAVPAWRSNTASQGFVLKARWTSPAGSGLQESWKASFSCRHRNIVVEKHKQPKPRLKLVG
ncbi:MAG: hypothetical protein ABTQ31_13190 [Rhizobiaceae bacterium]